MPSRRSVFASVAAAAALLGACSGGGDERPRADAPPTAGASIAAVTAVHSPASILRANLTALLQEHVFLTGALTGTVVAGQDPAPAAAVLDGNSVALSYVVGAVYGEPGAAQFLDLWRRHIGYLVDFARASAAGDEVAIGAAKAAMDGYRDEMATFLNTVNPNLAEADMAADQRAYLSAIQSAITSQAKGESTAAGKLKTAAEKMPRTAAIVVAGIAKNHPGMFEGRVDGSAATLRSVLASKLQEHVYLSWVATGAVTAGGDAAKDSLATLDDNSVELSNVIGAAYGDEAAKQFLALWRDQVSAYVDYARARAGEDADGARAAATRLAAEPARYGAFLHAANPHLDEAELTAELAAHTRALLAAIDTQIASTATRFADIHAAAGRTPRMALRLSTGIVTQFPARFS